MKNIAIFVFVAATFNSLYAHQAHSFLEEESLDVDWLSSRSRTLFQERSCQPATTLQIKQVNEGNQKADLFLNSCNEATGESPWCLEVMRPNPSSIETFRCTYGENQPHQFINPNENTWTYAFQAVKLVEELQDMNIEVCQIYNWWRPEPYNENVGGAAGRHPQGTSVDVRFCSLIDMERAHSQLCKWRKQGRLRALGYYGSTGLHLGIGDSTANTWGKGCP